MQQSPLSKIVDIAGEFIIPTTPHFFRNVFAIGCALLAVTAFAGTVLWIPYTRRQRRKNDDSAARREKRTQTQTDAAAFDAMFWDEYDAMMAAGAAGAAGATGAAGVDAEYMAPVSVFTPLGDVAMAYVPSRGAFGYYTDRRGSIAYTHLETVARKFLLHHARPDLAKLAYADRRLKGGVVEEGEDAILVPVHAPVAPVAPVVPVVPVAPIQGIFARLRSYNRKPTAATADTGGGESSSAAAAPLEYTRFVWLGTLHDLAEASTPPATTHERVDYDYAEFKRLRAATSVPASEPESEPVSTSALSDASDSSDSSDAD